MFPTIVGFINGFFFGIFCVIVSVPFFVWKSSERTKASALAMCGLSPFAYNCSTGILQEPASLKSQYSQSASPRTVPVDCGSYPVSTTPSSVSSIVQRFVHLGFPPSPTPNSPRDRESTVIPTSSSKKTKKQRREEAFARAKFLMQSDKEKVESNLRRRGFTPQA